MRPSNIHVSFLPKFSDRQDMKHSAEPDQTALRRAVFSGLSQCLQFGQETLLYGYTNLFKY